jgi:drug/metabolite transporter (DMT)-like permease
VVVGVIPAVLAAVGFASFQLVNRRALSGVDVFRGTATLLGVGAALLLLVAWLTGGLALVPAAPVSALLFCAAAGFVHFFCGWTLLGWSQVRLGVAKTGILIGTVPLFGALVAAVALDERLTAPAVLGLLIVTAGVAVVSARGGTGVTSVTDARVGVAAGLATALCWSVSPVLIRQGLEGLPSPLAGAAIGMFASALVYAAAVMLTARRAGRAAVVNRTRQLLLLGGVLVSLSIWMQWVAFDLAPVASVLALLQLTPVTVVLLASRLGGDELTGTVARRVWTGASLTVAGSLVLVLAA